MKREVEAYRTTLDLGTIFNDKTSLTQVIDALSSIYNYLFDYTNSISDEGVVNCRFKTNFSGFDDNEDVEIIFYRMETDEEYDKRLRFEQKNKYELEKKRLRKEKKERTEYERLKKKFGYEK